MTLRHMLADLRVFSAVWMSLVGIGGVLHGEISNGLLISSVIGAIGLSSLFLMWLAAKTGER